MEVDNIHVVAVGSDTVDLVAVVVVGLAASMMAFVVVQIAVIVFRRELVAVEPVLVLQMGRLVVVDLGLADLDLGLAEWPLLVHLAQQPLVAELAVAVAVASAVEMLVVSDANIKNPVNSVNTFSTFSLKIL